MSKKSAVVAFIDSERAKGTNDQAIQHKLLDAGWQMDIIKHAMGELEPGAQKHSGSTALSQNAKKLSLPIIIASVFIVLVLLALFI